MTQKIVSDKAPPASDDNTDGSSMRVKMEQMLREAQISITKAIEDIDGGAKFREDAWERSTGGGGKSRVLSNGNVWEKAGVALSVVHGTISQEALKQANDRSGSEMISKKEENVPFFAAGLSCVMHPRNPHCPTMHFNYRYFETEGGENWWFGGVRFILFILDILFLFLACW